ncbi:hypothetical protein ALQ34_200011 [Pseudomonas syringae pv. maculicola]|nr:hypothetical protein ALQ34_200011 [Pseudomonas syringae pv. maculicola]
MSLQHVLRGDDQGDGQHSVLRQLVEQGMQGITAFTCFASQVAGLRCFAQPIQHDDSVRLAIEVPQAFLTVGFWLSIKESLCEVVASDQWEILAGILCAFVHQLKEAIKVFERRSQVIGVRVEPLQEPVSDVVTVHPFAFNAGVGQTSCEALTNVVQVHGRGLATERCITDYPAIHDYPHSALLATPRQF